MYLRRKLGQTLRALNNFGKVGKRPVNMHQFETQFPGFAANDEDTSAVGREIRYNLPRNAAARAEVLRRFGKVAVGKFKIIGMQKNHAGEVCYRAVSSDPNFAHPDDFGRCIHPSLVSFC